MGNGGGDLEGNSQEAKENLRFELGSSSADGQSCQFNILLNLLLKGF